MTPTISSPSQGAIAPPLSADTPPSPAYGRSQTAYLIGLLPDKELFHTPAGEPFICFHHQGHRETWSLRARPFASRLRRQFYSQRHRLPDKGALADALTILSDQALFEGPQLSVHTRVAASQDALYLDLADPAWRCVEVTSAGWRVRDQAPVHFRRSDGMLPLPAPLPGGTLAELRPFTNIEGGPDEALLRAWLLAALRPSGPYPLLALHGEQGSAKSTTTRLLRALIDPHTAETRSEPTGVRDLLISATHCWVVVLDNLSRLPAWLSDALCRLSTGGGLATRTLYTNQEQTLLVAQRPVILNAIEEVICRSDLLDRAVVLHLPPMPPGHHLVESHVHAAFAQARPRIVGALLSAVSHSLREMPDTRVPHLPRMADFMLWATAGEPGLELMPGTVQRAYQEQRDAARMQLLEDSPLTQPLVRLMAERKEPVLGTATELLELLGQRVDARTQNRSSWPKSSQPLAGMLRRLSPNLRAIGIEVEFTRATGGKRLIRISALL